KRFPTFLINSLACASTIGVHWHDVFSAYHILPLKAFLFRVRISSLLPAARRGILIYDQDFGQAMACSRSILIDKRYYLKPRAADDYVYPYFAHPTFYINQLSICACRLAACPKTMRLFFSGTVEREQYSGVARLFGILTRSEIIDHVLGELT